MSNGNKSFFERLTGTVNLDENSQRQPQQPQQPSQQQPQQADAFENDFQQDPYDQAQPNDDTWEQPEQQQAEEAGELAVDVYETPDHVIVQTMVAGVRPDHLDVSITRDRCTINGRREGPHDVPPEDYHHQELYWGSFSRSVALPEEVEVDAAEASESHGLLTITLPKIKTDRETQLEIHSG